MDKLLRSGRGESEHLGRPLLFAQAKQLGGEILETERIPRRKLVFNEQVKILKQRSIEMATKRANKRITGGPISPKPYLSYLTKKYSDIYR